MIKDILIVSYDYENSSVIESMMSFIESSYGLKINFYIVVIGNDTFLINNLKSFLYRLKRDRPCNIFLSSEREARSFSKAISAECGMADLAKYSVGASSRGQAINLGMLSIKNDFINIAPGVRANCSYGHGIVDGVRHQNCITVDPDRASPALKDTISPERADMFDVLSYAGDVCGISTDGKTLNTRRTGAPVKGRSIYAFSPGISYMGGGDGEIVTVSQKQNRVSTGSSLNPFCFALKNDNLPPFPPYDISDTIYYGSDLYGVILSSCINDYSCFYPNEAIDCTNTDCSSYYNCGSEFSDYIVRSLCAEREYGYNDVMGVLRRSLGESLSDETKSKIVDYVGLMRHWDDIRFYANKLIDEGTSPFVEL